MLRKASAKFLLYCLSSLFVFLFFLPASYALSQYQRGARSKQYPHAPNRYNYVLPGYIQRQPQRVKKKQCKQHGRALCLGPKTPNYFDIYSRNHHNGVYINKTHPYLRKTIPAKTLRVR